MRSNNKLGVIVYHLLYEHNSTSNLASCDSEFRGDEVGGLIAFLLRLNTYW
jgi:hypothetical protein